MPDTFGWLANQRKNDVAYFDGVNWRIQHPEWTAYTPTITSGTGAFTAVSGAGRYSRLGNILSISVTVTITTNNTAATYISVPLPTGMTSAATGFVIAGRETTNGKMLQGFILASGTAFIVVNYDNTYPGANGNVCVVSGVLELA